MDKAGRFRIWMFLVAAVVLVADQFTKMLAVTYLGPDTARGFIFGRARQVIPGFFDFRWAENTGGAFSFLHTKPWLVLAVAVLMVVIITIWGLMMKQRNFVVQLALGLIIGGAVGNVIDRVRFGFVIDFLHFYIVRNGREYFWPTFNIADMGIVGGILLFVYLTAFTGMFDPEEITESSPQSAPSLETKDPNAV